MEIERRLITRKQIVKRYAAGERNFANLRITSSVLSQVDLSGADLSGTDLSGADLSGARMLGVNLTNANLRRANLRGVDLSGADCIRTDFSYADLDYAVLSGAIFDGANFYGSEMDNAIVVASDFTGAENFNGPGVGSFFRRTLLTNDNFIEGPNWLE